MDAPLGFLSQWTPMTFGRHDGLTLPQIMFRDPDWFFWAWQATDFMWPSPREAAAVNQRARSIRVPARFPLDTLVEYSIDRRSGRFGGMRLVPVGPAGVSYCGGYNQTFTRDLIDMSVPHKLHDYDKGGMKILVRDLKEIIFAGPGIRMTKSRAEDFFSDDRNFCLPSSHG